MTDRSETRFAPTGARPSIDFINAVNVNHAMWFHGPDEILFKEDVVKAAG